MKKFKFSMVAILAIVLGIGVSAFTVKQHMKDPPIRYYQFMGSSQQLLVESQWDEVQSTTASGCNSQSGVNCTITLSGDGAQVDHPDFQAAGIDNQTKLDDVTNSFRD
jgi:hypothetical protein